VSSSLTAAWEARQLVKDLGGPGMRVAAAKKGKIIRDS